jgi:hypothetical protein
MGDGTLQEALNWLEYCNGTGDTYVTSPSYVFSLFGLLEIRMLMI